MKTTHSKLFGILITGILGILFVTCCNNPDDTSQTDDETSPWNREGGWQSLKKAQANLFVYRLWWEHVAPEKVRYANDTLYFDPVPVTNGIVKPALEMAFADSTELSFHGKDGLNFGYYIPWEDIRNALKIDTDVKPYGDLKGIRVYVASNVKGLQNVRQLSNPDSVSSYLKNYNSTSTHVYVIPASSVTDDKVPFDSNDFRFVYDLTTPCPNSCDEESPLYNLDSLASS